MELKLKKLIPLSGILLSCLTATALSAHEMHQMQQQSVGQIADHDSGKYREITPNAGPRVSEGADVILSADFIYWHSQQEGLEYAGKGFSSSGDAPCGGTLRPDFGFDPGFKVDLGLGLGHDGWDIIAEYTWLHSSDSSSTPCQGPTEIDNGPIYPLWNIGGVVPYNPTSSDILGARLNRWKLRFNVIDLEMGRNFFVSQYLKMRPFIGFKGAWIDQEYDVTYRAANDRILRMKQDHDFWGFGLRTGMDLAWHFAKDWSFYGDIALSTLWSQFDVHRTDTITTNGVDSSKPVNRGGDGSHRMKPVIETGLGLRWQIWFGDHDDYHFLVQAGWENQVWWGQNKMITQGQGASNGDLSLQGLTLKIRFDF